jgi:putative flippase GtrA
VNLLFGEFLRYNAVGIVNTLIGFGLIFTLMFSGMDAKASNFFGYLVGAVISYILNSLYTFRQKPSLGYAWRFFSVLLVSYTLNYLVLIYMLEKINPYAAQVVAGAIYTTCSFVLAKYFVFRT